jgi:hypothetical protein
MWQIVAVQASEAIAAVPVFSGVVAGVCHKQFKHPPLVPHTGSSWVNWAREKLI